MRTRCRPRFWRRTEVLAEQHFLTLSNLLRESAVKIDLFTQRTKRTKRDSANIMAGLSKGETHLAVGTQALIQEDVEFANLGLVVVDEQHKLGVRQRARCCATRAICRITSS